MNFKEKEKFLYKILKIYPYKFLDNLTEITFDKVQTILGIKFRKPE